MDGKELTIKDSTVTFKATAIKHDIFCVENFLSPEESAALIKYFDSVEAPWGNVAFFGALGAGMNDTDERLIPLGLPADFISTVRKNMLACAEQLFERPLRANTSHVQKWIVGGYANPHSDNTNMDGSPSAFEINKYVSLIYLNDDYEGGNIYFPDHGIELKPAAGTLVTFPGGMENIHGVSEVTGGVRYTIMAFWDYAEAEYSEQRKAEWAEEIARVREEQAKQRAEWDANNR